MKNITTALRDGFRATLRLHLLLPWYVCVLLLGLLQSWPLWSAGGRALRNPILGELAGGDLDTLVNLLLDNPVGLATATSWAGLLLPLTLLSGLFYTFFAGGLLSTYTGTGSLWAGCRRFWWPFLGLGALLTGLIVLVVAAAAIVAGLGGATAALVFVLVALALINLVGEYARAIGVVYDRRNPLGLLGQAIIFCLRHIGGVLVLALLATLLYALLVAAYTLLSPLLGASPLLVVAQQVFVFGTLWIKALRLALAARYVMSHERTQDE